MSREQWGRGNIYQRGRVWWIRFPDGCGGQRREGAGADEMKARRLLERRLVEAEDDRLPAKARERRRSVNDLLDALVKDFTARQCDSTTGLASLLKPVRRAFGQRRAGSLTKPELTQYLLDRRAAGYAEATISRELGTLKQAYRLQKAIAAPDFPPLPQGKVRDVLISPSEQRLLLAAIEDETCREATAFKFATGWRGQEVLTLKWSYVRGESGLIRLSEEHAKTGEPRDFPLVGLVAELIAQREAQRRLECPFVFHRAGQPLTYRIWRRAWQRAACAAGLGRLDEHGKYQGVNLHDTRRAFITDAVDAGIDPQTVRTLSGHRSNAIFERYRILKSETLARAIERREQYLEAHAGEHRIVALAGHRKREAGQIAAAGNLFRSPNIPPRLTV